MLQFCNITAGYNFNLQLLLTVFCFLSACWIKTNSMIYMPIVFCPLTVELSKSVFWIKVLYWSLDIRYCRVRLYSARWIIRQDGRKKGKRRNFYKERKDRREKGKKRTNNCGGGNIFFPSRVWKILKKKKHSDFLSHFFFFALSRFSLPTLFCSLTSSNNDIHCHMLFLCFISRFHSPPISFFIIFL